MADVKYTIEVDAQSSTRTVDQLAESVNILTKYLENSGQSAKKSSNVFTELNSALQLAGKAYRTVTEGLTQVVDGLKRGSDVADVAQAFDNLSAKAGAVSDVLINDLRQAAGGTIDDFKLMQQANQLLNAGLDPSVYDDVIQAARRYADTVGGSAVESVDRLVEAFKKGDDRALKQQGILIDNQKAYEDYAKSIGATVETLSELGKAEAVRAAATEALIARRREFGDVENDIADNLNRVEAAAKNAFDKFFEGIATNENLNKAVSDFADSLDRLVRGGALENLVKEFNTTINAGLRFVKFLELGKIEIELFLLKIASLDKSFAKLPTGIGDAGFKLGKYIGELIKGTSSTEKLVDVQEKERVELQKQAELLSRQIELGNEIVKLDAREEQANKGKTAQLKKLGEQTEKNIKLTNDSNKERKSETDLILETERELQKLGRAQQDGSIDAGEYARAVEKLAAAFKVAGGDVSRFGQIADKVQIDLKDAFKGQGFGKSFLENFLNIDLSDDALKRFNLADQLGSQIGSLLGDTAIALTDGKIGDEEAKQLAVSIGGVIGGAIGAYFGTLAGGNTAAGAIVGSSIGSFIGGLFAHESSAATKARKSVDEFFNDIFNEDRLTVIIGGKLQRIESLTTSLFGSGGGIFDELANGGYREFVTGGQVNAAPGIASGEEPTEDNPFDAFSQLPGIAQQAFNGVGKAFSQLIGVADEIAEQVGVIFASNLGASINNLQLLIEATGLSAEELAQGLTDAFLTGAISAAEAQDGFIGIQRTLEKGIPDGVGLVIEAFDNLAAAGTNGGRAAVDAIRDIASEAKEKFGAEGTLAQVRDELIASGKFTTEEIDRFFQLLQENGIDSLEELENASTEAIIAILAKLQEEGKILQETGEKVKEVAAVIEKIPDSTEKEVVFKVRVEFDEAAQSSEGQAAIAASGGENNVSIPRSFQKTLG